MIEARNVIKKYGAVTALDDFTVDIPEGKIGILGPNGAGKSTLFKLIIGNLKPDYGNVFFKNGAEGVFLAIIPEQKSALAVKIIDGTRRAAEVAIAGLISELRLVNNDKIEKIKIDEKIEKKGFTAKISLDEGIIELKKFYNYFFHNQLNIDFFSLSSIILYFLELTPLYNCLGLPILLIGSSIISFH